MNLQQFVTALNTWGASRTPFFFFTDFELNKPRAFRLDEVDPDVLQYSINGFSNSPSLIDSSGSVELQVFPVSFEDYDTRFNRVQHHLGYGDSFLLNLTVKTPIALNCSLQEVYNRAQARYKCWYQNEFIVFSPETFVQIRGNKIYAYPMKGTIDASLPSATEQILNDPKEKAEHVTIVDLIRNDLSQVATAIEVTRFRYVEEIKTNRARLLQVSSEITGRLPDNFHHQLGNLLVKLLPAGSVSGAPKTKTCSVIRSTEGADRGFYTGVLGYFDGVNLDSGVMIRFIEYQDGQYYYRSGGGVTTQSEAAKEYQELLDKIYVPVT